MMRHVTSFVNMVMERRGVFELRSACRALEADIICAWDSSASPDGKAF